MGWPQVHDTLEALLAALEQQASMARQLGVQQPPSTDAAAAAAFTAAATSALLALPPRRKGRYVPLALLLPRVGARALMQQQPQLVEQV